MKQLPLVLLMIGFPISLVSQANDSRFRPCSGLGIKLDPDSLWYFPEWVFPEIEYKTTSKRVLDLPEDFVLLYELKMRSDTFRTYARDLNLYDQKLNQIYSRFLKNYEEPILCDIKEGQEIYRLIWQRTFHSPVLIRLEKFNDFIKIYWKVGNGMAGFDKFEKIVKQGSKKVKPKYWIEFENVFQEIDFWDRINYRDLPGNDGSIFFLEATTSNQYNALFYSGDLNGSGFMKACKMLVGMTNLRIREKEFY